MNTPNMLLRALRLTFVLAALMNSTSGWPAATTEVQLLVDTAWLNKNHATPQLRIFDVRTSTEFAAGHIDGAVSVPVDRLFIIDGIKRQLAPIGQVRKVFSAAGLDNDSVVVIYDSGEFVNSARAFWVLEVYGHNNVMILDGGYPAWTGAKLPVSTKELVPAPGKFVPTIIPNRLATKLSTRLAIDQHSATIIDARPSEHYSGEQSMAERYGHIPSATNIPVNDVFEVVNGIKRLKQGSALKERFRSIDPSKRVITYCNDGGAAASTYFVLRSLGIDVATYGGSWVEWGNDPVLPVEGPAMRAP